MGVVGKVFKKELNKRVKVLTVHKVMDEQGIFSVRRTCSDHIFAVEEIVEKDKSKYTASVHL